MAFADDYVGVHERIDKFLEKYPDGRIQTAIAHLSESLVVMQATVYRDAADERPIIAHSQLGIPGKTNFTRDSEVENAETSAVGRALAFMGFETKKGIASREEVNSRRPDPEPKPDAGWWEGFREACGREGVTAQMLATVLGELPTLKSVQAWVDAEPDRHWANLVAEAKRKEPASVG